MDQCNIQTTLIPCVYFNIVAIQCPFHHLIETTQNIRNNISCQDCLNVLAGCVYSGVETLGKELFMFFGQKALRIHFGMNGSLRLNEDGRENRSKALSIVEIQLTTDLVTFYDATVELRNAADSEQKIRMLGDLDICSSKFSFLRAESEIKKQNDRMVCDVLLDQAILPGVGNIIKNEALFDSGLHPVVKCRKTGSALYKHYKVYKRPSCGQCREKITVCRLGENNRMTYFCPQCQKDNPHLVDPRVVIKTLQERANLILIALWRPSQPWFASLLQMSSEYLRLAQFPELLSLDNGQVLHPDLNRL
ncbi:hypothetical protein JRQ81_015931 [Phrynocephalus forsythii]|uniref:DNA-(apurinic or apyrimidinic site) lyase n=1 Tax=Phrynocephalus forsythii TaxID=171643 RepID=A0A9Q0XXI0_9SAUR|nr:hypothetical protein JRQ81_015931 [Phrynocephalus forsythii]